MKITAKTYGLILFFLPLTDYAQIITSSDVETAENFRRGFNIDSAVVYYQKAADAFLASNQIESFVNAHNQIGIMLTRKGRYDNAKEHLNLAMDSGKSLGENNLTAAATFLALGVVYAAEGHFEQSLALHDKALQIRLKNLGENHADVATSYGNIGNVHFRKKSYDRAIEAHLKALHIRRAVFGEFGAELTQSYVNLGNAYREKKQFQNAVDYFQMALQNKIREVGENHKELKRFYSYLSEAYYLAGDKTKGDSSKTKGLKL